MPKNSPSMGGIIQNPEDAGKPANPETAQPAKPAAQKTYFKSLSIKLDEDTYRRLRLTAAQELRTHQDIVEAAIKRYLDDQ